MSTTNLGLLLVVVLAVSWTAAVPLPATPEIEKDDVQTFLKENPSIAREIYINLLNDALGAQERRKRETTVTGDVSRKVTPTGHSDSGSGTVIQTLSDKHAVSGTVGGTRDTIRGLGSLDTISAGGAFQYSPRDDTTLSIGGKQNWRSDGITRTDIGGALEHQVNNEHSLGGNLGISNTNVPGFGNFDTHTAGVDYTWTPNKQTKFTVGGHTSRSPFGRDTGLSAIFTHHFG